MGLNIPKWEELSKDEQIPIVNLPLTGNYVIVGGPGTGKTILAIYRGSRWRKEQKNSDSKVQFLVYNKTLKQYIADSLSAVELPSSYADTWHKWIWHFYKQQTKETIPQISDYNYDWEKVKEKLMRPELLKTIDYLIIDEAQDLPVDLLQILNHLCKHVTIFGDSQQALDNTTTTSDFSHVFGAERKVYYLNQNYRNTKEISEVAHLFYAGDPGDIPARPKRTGAKPRLIRCKDFQMMAEIIANYARNNPSHIVGVLVHDYKYVFKFKKALEELGIAAQKYVSGSATGKDSFSFDDEGIKLLTYNTMKGLEFDAVFLPNIDDPYFRMENPSKLKRIYVASTRAKYSLTFLYEEEDVSFVLERLINNLHLLDIEELDDDEDIQL